MEILMQEDNHLKIVKIYYKNISKQYHKVNHLNKLNVTPILLHSSLKMVGFMSLMGLKVAQLTMVPVVKSNF